MTPSERQEHLDPEGQEYVYRLVWKRHSTGEVTQGRAVESVELVSRVAADLTDEFAEAWVERALLGTWERV